MKQLRRLRRKLAVAIGRYLQVRKLQRAKIDIDAKCPACGHGGKGKGRIEFSEEERLIIHHCLICYSRWGEETIVPVDAWLRRHPYKP